MELDGSNNVVRKYTWGLDLAGQNGSVNSLEGAGTIGGLLATWVQTTVGYHSHAFAYTYDANGNVSEVVDAYYLPEEPENAIMAHYEYTPFGRVLSSTGDYAAENPFRFSTKYFDDETGLGYWGYRYYSPTLGRWLSRDPIGVSAGPSEYSYADNHSVAAIDPVGLCESTAGYTYNVANPTCGFWVICPVDLDLSNSDSGIDHAKVKGADPKGVRGFEVHFFKAYDDRIGGLIAMDPRLKDTEACCCACDDESPGAIRLVQVIKSGSRPTVVDPEPTRNKKKFDYPHGYVEGGGMKGTTEHSYKDAPALGSADTVHLIEACAICRHNGKDTVLGCMAIAYHDGTRENSGRDSYITSHKGQSVLLAFKYDGRICFGDRSRAPTTLFKTGISNWKKKYEKK